MAVWFGAKARHFSGSASMNPGALQKRERQILRNRMNYEIQYSQHGRIIEFLKQTGVVFPRLAIRRFFKRHGSKSAFSIMYGFAQAFILAPRLISKKIDKRYRK